MFSLRVLDLESQFVAMKIINSLITYFGRIIWWLILGLEFNGRQMMIHFVIYLNCSLFLLYDLVIHLRAHCMFTLEMNLKTGSEKVFKIFGRMGGIIFNTQ